MHNDIRMFDGGSSTYWNLYRKYSFTRGNGFSHRCVKAFNNSNLGFVTRLMYDNKSSGHGFSTRYGNPPSAPPLFIGGNHERRIL